MVNQTSMGERLEKQEAVDVAGHAVGMADASMEVDVEQLPQELRALVAQLKAVPPTITEVDLYGSDQGGDYFRSNPEGEVLKGEPADADTIRTWWDVRVWVLGLIGSCASVKVVKLRGCGISRESEVERLCQGLRSNTGLRYLALDENMGFGSDLGFQQVSHILASSTTLETLEMDGVGMRETGLCLILGALLQNTGSRLLVLDVEHNPDCLGDEAAQLLAQLLSDPRTGSCLRELRIRETGLSAAGAARLSATLAQNSGLQKLRVGPVPILNLKTIISSVGVPKLVLECTKEEGLAMALAEMLTTSTTLRKLWLYEGHFSTVEWRGIFRALHANTTLVYLELERSKTLDHSLIDDLQQLAAANPNLFIPEIAEAPLKGRHDAETGTFFWCCCPSCAAAVVASPKLTRLMDELSVTNPCIESIGPNDWGGELLVPRSSRSGHVVALRRRLFGLIGTCVSLRSIEFLAADVFEREDEKDMEALCAGLQSNSVLETLAVRGSQGFGSDLGCAQLAKVVVGCARTLRLLNLSGVGMTSSGLLHLTRALTLDTGVSVLKSLSLNNNHRLGDAGAALIAQFLDNSTPIRVLDMRGIGMGARGAHSLSLALQLNTSLEQLWFGEAHEGPTRIVMEGLVHGQQHSLDGGPCNNNRTLTSLGLFKLGYPETGLVEVVARVLQTNTSLRELWIKDAAFAAEEWKAVFGALERNQVLRVLTIHSSFRLEPVFKDLMELLQVNITIEEVNLKNTDLNSSGKVPLVKEALQRNKQQAQYLGVLKDKLQQAQPSTGRLFLCGSPFAGKSTLRESMVRCHQQPTCGPCRFGAFLLGQPGLRSLRPRTEGIQIQVLREDEDMQISIWDMAGQEHYYALHDHLFPTTNQACIFIFVYNPFYDRRSGDSVLREEDLHEKLLHWLRFITSNSQVTGHVLPLVCVVITHLDQLPLPKYTSEYVVRWATPEVDKLRDQFHGVVQVSERIHAVKAFSVSSVEPVVQRVFEDFQDLLKQKLRPVFRACDQMSLALAKQSLQRNAKPMVPIDEFFKMCSEKVEALRDLFEDQSPATSGYAVEEYVRKAKAAVAAYLHDVGSIVHFPDLDFVVVNPNWLGNIFLPQFIKFGADLHGDEFSPGPKEGFIDEIEIEQLLTNFLRVNQRSCSGCSVDDLLGLLLKLELCVKEDISSTRVRYFVPSYLASQSGVVSNPSRKTKLWRACFESRHESQMSYTLTWQIRIPDAEATSIGIRLRCQDTKTTMLTPGFFSRLQVHLPRVLQEIYNMTPDQEQLRCNIKYNLMRVRLRGWEVLVENGGDDNPTFVDILIRGENKGCNGAWDLIQYPFIKEIQKFCASPKGCPGVVLIECIVRPECVHSLRLCRDREVVPMKVLTENVVSTIVASACHEGLDYEHQWGEGSTKAIDLLDGRMIEEMLQREKDIWAKVQNQIVESIAEVIEPPQNIIEDMSNPQHFKSLETQPTYMQPFIQHVDKRLDELGERFDKVDKRLDEQKDLLLKIGNSIDELKLQQRQTQDALAIGVNDVMHLITDIEKSTFPRFPYLTDEDVGISQRFAAFLNIGRPWKLHFMCEDRDKMHYVKDQPGYAITIQEQQNKKWQTIAFWSAEVLYILANAALQIGASAGGIIPHDISWGSQVLPITSQNMRKVLDDIKRLGQSVSRNQDKALALAHLQDFLKKVDIVSNFQLFKVEFLQPDKTRKLPRYGWVCEACRERGVRNRTLRM